MQAIRAVKVERSSVSRFDPLRFCAPPVTAVERRALVAEAAYFRAERRRFEAGHELEDWLAAEAEVDRSLASGAAGIFRKESGG
jgi:hypothetical protein